MNTVGAQFGGSNDPLLAAATRVIDSVRAVLSSYGMPRDARDPYAALHDARLRRPQGQHAFQWSTDPEESLTWMTRFIDAGLARVKVPDP